MTPTPAAIFSTDNTPPPAAAGRTIVLFDGDCVLCHGWARFIAERDPRCQFALGALQSPTGAALLAEHHLPADLTSIVLLRGARSAVKSDAILEIAGQLSGPWPLAGVFRLVPRLVRDAVYDFIAARRYRWFGHGASCPLPTPAMRARMLP